MSFEMFGCLLSMLGLLALVLLGICREIALMRLAIMRLCEATEAEQDDISRFPSYTLNEGDVDLIENCGFFR